MGVAAACEAPRTSLDSVSQPIVAGTPITGDPAIMELLSFRGQQGARCTATLITPRLLLTAAHCISETPGFQRHVFAGNDDRRPAPSDMLVIKEVVPHPLYTTPRQGNDFCILVLQAPVGIKPMPLNRAAVESAQGKTVRYVGYGIVTVGNLNSGGIKRQNTAPLAQVSRLLLTIGPNANQSCEGDSGGPLLLDDGQGEALIGVSSFVDAPACRRNSFFQRVDTQIGWIDEQIQKYDPTGMAPADAGMSDGQSPVVSDAGLPEASSQPPPIIAVDAQAPPADSGAGNSTPTPDTRAPDVPRSSGVAPHQPAPSTTTGDTGGGCSYSAAAGRGDDGRSLGGGLALLLVALTFARAFSRRFRARQNLRLRTR